jgi:hypothetical protein
MPPGAAGAQPPRHRSMLQLVQPPPRRVRSLSQELAERGRQELATFDFDDDDASSARAHPNSLSAAASLARDKRPKERFLVPKQRRPPFGQVPRNSARAAISTSRSHIPHHRLAQPPAAPNTAARPTARSLSSAELHPSPHDEYDSFTSLDTSALSTGSAKSSSHSYTQDSYKHAYFALGCFWHTEAVFGGVDGVGQTCVGFVAGVEVCKVSFDPSAVSYRGLLDVWKDDHDPTRKWANKKFMSAVFAGCTQRKQAVGEVGVASVQKLSAFTEGPAKDQLYHVRKKKPAWLSRELSPRQVSERVSLQDKGNIHTVDLYLCKIRVRYTL